MPVYVYDCKDNNCICVLEDDRRLYDKPASGNNANSRKLLGRLDVNYRVFYDENRTLEAGATEESGYVYSDMDNMCVSNRVGYIDGNKVYAYVPSEIYSTPEPSLVAYMEGDGDMKEAGAAALLLALAKGGRPQSRSSSYSSSRSSSNSSSSNSSTSSSSTYKARNTANYTPPQKKKAPMDAGEFLGWAILVVIVLFILEKLFG